MESFFYFWLINANLPVFHRCVQEGVLKKPILKKKKTWEKKGKNNKMKNINQNDHIPILQMGQIWIFEG